MGRRKQLAVLLIAALLSAAAPAPAPAVSREVARALRDVYEGRTLRLRVDLRSAGQAIEPNVMTLEGIGYGREGSPVLFSRLETVFLERITSEGGSRMALTVYRSEEEMKRLRAGAIPPAIMGMPSSVQPTTRFAFAGSTTVMLELNSGKKDAEGQRNEIGTLLRRLFYIDSEPGRDELERYVLDHRTLSVGRLAAITGLSQDDVRRLIETAPAPVR